MVNKRLPDHDTDDPTGLVAALAELDWGFADADTQAGGHSLHVYPAKFPPQIPRRLVEVVSRPGDLVLDPFGGSGTTALEAVRLGRAAVSVDANPIAVLIARVKSNPPDRRELGSRLDKLGAALLRRLSTCTLSRCPSAHRIPEIANRDKWFAECTVHELAHIRSEVEEWPASCRDFGLLALGQAAARTSFQESETRYVSVPRQVTGGEAVDAFVKEAGRMVARLPDDVATGRSTVVVGDCRQRHALPLRSGTADLVVTSPPYPNAYDYHLYHRFRLLWTGHDPVDLRRVEIGSHLRQQGVADPIADYERDMRQVVHNLWDVIRNGGWCVMVVGDGIYQQATYSTSTAISRIAAEVGFEIGGTITRPLPDNRRSVTSAGRRLAGEQLVFLRRPTTPGVRPPLWPMFEFERHLADRELEHLAQTADPVRARWSRLTFAKGVAQGVQTGLTTQGLLEATDPGRRKNSTYATHGIHRYKGKFYPQLGRCLLNLSCSRDALVLDPFAGSGTIALESTLLGLRSHGIELSPVGAAIAQAKISAMYLPASILRAVRSSVVPAVVPVPDIDWAQFHEATRPELESWFPEPVLRRLSHLLRRIRSLVDGSEWGVALRQLGEVCVSDIVRDISQQDPTDLRIRRRPTPLADAPVEELFNDRWKAAIDKIISAREVVGAPIPGLATIVCGDSGDEHTWPQPTDGGGQVDAIVTSPPYAAALPYLDTDRLSLAAVFGYSKPARAELEERLVGSREISERGTREWDDELRSGRLAEVLPASTAAFLLALADAVRADEDAGFRRRQTPAVLTRYFVSMSKVIGVAARRLASGADAWFIMGDSKTTVGGRTWLIPTTDEIRAVAKHHGLQFVEAIPISVTRDSMRHAKNAITRNTLLHFRAP